MLFNSYAFLMAFLPIAWLLYFGLNRIKQFRLAQIALILASFIFYGYGDWRLCLLLGTSILVNYFLHCLLSLEHCLQIHRKLLLVIGLVVNFALLFYFKYLDFAITNINFLTGSLFTLQHIVLPLGISFYTFQQVSFIIDSYYHNMKKYRFVDYALFVAFFPQLVAGPIVLHQEMIPQFMDPEKKKVNFSNMISGTEYIIWGLSKKVLLADTFGRLSDVGFAAPGSLNSLSAAAVILAYTLEIYFDFSGYCDMAIGLGKLFNIEIPLNFNSPYKAVNISDFWKRWHITLTRFLTIYLYIPLGGNRKGKWNTYRNVLIVFALSGLWHGADWNFVIWGCMHGIMMVLYRMTRNKADRVPRWISWCITFLFVNMAWVFFRAESLIQPFKLYYKLLLGGGGGFIQGIMDTVYQKNFIFVFAERFCSQDILTIFSMAVTALWLIGGTIMCAFAPSTHEIVSRKHRNRWYYLGLTVLFFSSVIRLSEVSKFIYFNF